MPDNRKSKRWHLVYYLPVTRESRGDVLGHVVDLTPEGMLLIGTSAPAAETRFQLSIWVPGDNGESAIEVTAQSLWTRPSQHRGFHESGFVFIEPCERVRARLGSVIDTLRFHDDEAAA